MLQTPCNYQPRVQMSINVILKLFNKKNYEPTVDPFFDLATYKHTHTLLYWLIKYKTLTLPQIIITRNLKSRESVRSLKDKGCFITRNTQHMVCT